MLERVSMMNTEMGKKCWSNGCKRADEWVALKEYVSLRMYEPCSVMQSWMSLSSPGLLVSCEATDAKDDNSSGLNHIITWDKSA